MPHGNQLSVPQINTLRLRAVQLRIAGSTLKTISQDTGLSSPTIIAAYKAWQAGGWNAVPVRDRGRKQGEGRSLSAEQERHIYQLLVSTLPERHQLPFLLWQLEAMQALVKRLHGIDLPERTAAHYLQRWQLNAERPAKRVAKASPAVQRWYRSTYEHILDQARAQNGEILWITITVHPTTRANSVMAYCALSAIAARSSGCLTKTGCARLIWWNSSTACIAAPNARCSRCSRACTGNARPPSSPGPASTPTGCFCFTCRKPAKCSAAPASWRPTSASKLRAAAMTMRSTT
ncbi:winged helix-turn-helix domain-containing protein [Pseudomonas sp. VI4.1]|uniref:helix-turn-helix domain-containing protein n=1 Tax=Pseudomonas sp. VI4.1 TaxID=1941346 RepID=UPI0009D0FC32|nr:winged helix-turn-helix domain-containing protein [Pseudomonas sp. VI4.1]OPK08611.1 hypothetical protein BZ163_20295 [Pseudomonas sp. VI4.1]